MKLLPLALSLTCSALLMGCGRPNAGGGSSGADPEAQERLIEQQEALQLRQLHEREAALDEREQVLAQREQQTPPLSAQPPEQAAETEPPEQPAPVAVSAPGAAPATPAAPAAVSPDASYQAFYDALSAYGTWVQMPGYGFIWQPSATVQDPLWRPYTIGHWAFTDVGWTWVSDEPFGWITYHYGRWMRTRTLGWVWTPGEQWAPAWVSWRYGGDYAGWAPLPPEAQFDSGNGIQQWADQTYNLGPADYTWVPAAEFGDDNMADEEAPPSQTEAIYDDSNNITNIYYDTGTYAIVCYGPNYDFIRSRCRRPLHAPFTLMREGFHRGGKNGATVSGNTLRVAAPRIRHDPAPTAPRNVRGLVADTRLINQPSAPSAPGAAREPPVVHQPPRFPQAPQPPAGLHTPERPNPVAMLPQPGAVEEPHIFQPIAPAAMHTPSRMNPTAVPPDVDAQKAHDFQVIQQEQAARERQASDAARQAAQEKSAAEAAQARRAAADDAAKAAREQAATRQSQAAQAAQAARAASLPAGTQAPGRGQ